MRFLVDQCVSPRVAEGLRDRGFDAVHAEQLGSPSSTDEVLFALAAQQNRIILTADADFGKLLALHRSIKPSVMLFRDDAPATAHDILVFLDANLPQLEAALQQGAVAVVRATAIRIRTLPLF